MKGVTLQVLKFIPKVDRQDSICFYYVMSFFWRILSSRTFLYVVFLLAVLSISYYLVLGRVTESTLTNQLLDRQQIIARAETSNTTIFFERIGDAIATLAQLKNIESRNANALHDLDIFVQQRRESGLIGGVILTDQDGIVKLNSNVLGTEDTGQSLADRKYFTWAKDQAKKGDYYISSPVISRTGASKDQMIVPVISPVYQNDKFSGIVAASVLLEPLVNRFFGMMRVSDNTKIHLFDQNGNLLYGNAHQDKIGSNISDHFLDDLTLENKIKESLNGISEGQIKTDKNLAAYSPITLRTQTWLMVISSSSEQADNLMKPIYTRQIAILTLTALSFLLLAAISIRNKEA